MGRSRNTEENFWDRVSISGHPATCWPWQAGRTGSGYGAYKVGGKMKLAHRIAKLGLADYDNPLFVLHRCDNPRCCRPSHLFLGTQLENMRDRATKGRANQARGERCGASKLTMEQVIAIRAGRRQGLSADDLGRQYGIHRNHVYRLALGQRWQHVGGEV